MSSTQKFWSSSKKRSPRVRGEWGGLSTSQVSRMTGLPHRLVYGMLVRYKKRLGRTVDPQDLCLLLWEIVDSRIADEIKDTDDNYSL